MSKSSTSPSLSPGRQLLLEWQETGSTVPGVTEFGKSVHGEKVCPSGSFWCWWSLPIQCVWLSWGCVSFITEKQYLPWALLGFHAPFTLPTPPCSQECPAAWPSCCPAVLGLLSCQPHPLSKGTTQLLGPFPLCLGVVKNWRGVKVLLSSFLEHCTWVCLSSACWGLL